MVASGGSATAPSRPRREGLRPPSGFQGTGSRRVVYGGIPKHLDPRIEPPAIPGNATVVGRSFLRSALSGSGPPRRPLPDLPATGWGNGSETARCPVLRQDWHTFSNLPPVSSTVTVRTPRGAPHRQGKMGISGSLLWFTVPFPGRRSKQSYRWQLESRKGAASWKVSALPQSPRACWGSG